MAIPREPEKTFTVTVTNTTETELVDHFDGVAYTFPPKKAVQVPNDVARHILGYGNPDKQDNVVRLGWAQFNTEVPKALARLARFKCDPPETRGALSPVAERVPLNSPTGEGGKLVA
jgi:hypothetical protein